MEQLKKLLASLSMRQRISIVVVVVLAAAGLTGLLQYRKEADFKALFTGLAPEDTAAVVQKLKESSTEYRIGEGGRSVSVSSAKVAEMRLEMAAAGLPKTGRAGFEIFDKNNLGATEFVEHINYQRAMEGELERSVMSLAEVEQARVHITFAKNSVFVTSREPAKASVLVKLRPGAHMAERNVLAVRHLVAAAVEGLTIQSVQVVDMAGNMLSHDRTPEEEAKEAAFDFRQRFERDLLQKVNTTLEPLLGKDRFRANVMVECDMTTGEQSEETVDPSQSVIVTSQNTEESTNVATAAASGVPGTASNLPRPTRPNNAGGNTTRRTENVTYQSSRTTRTTKTPQGTIKRISVGVLLDQDLRWEGTGPGARRILVPPSAETVKSVRDVVAAVVGLSEEREDKISVETLPFESTLRLPPPNAPSGAQPAKPQTTGNFLSELQKDPRMLIAIAALLVLLIVVVAGAAWMIVKSRKKAVAAELEAREIAAARAAAGELSAGAPSGAAAALGAAPGHTPVEGGLAQAAAQLAAADAAAANSPAGFTLTPAAEIEEDDLSTVVPALKLPTINKKSKAMARHVREQCSRDASAFAAVLQTWINEKN